MKGKHYKFLYSWFTFDIDYIYISFLFKIEDISVEMCNMVFFTLWLNNELLDIENIMSQSALGNVPAKFCRGLN